MKEFADKTVRIEFEIACRDYDTVLVAHTGLLNTISQEVAHYNGVQLLSLESLLSAGESNEYDE